MSKIWKIIFIIIAVPVGIFFLLFVLFLGIFGYRTIKYPDSNCHNTNKIFNEYSPQSFEYKTELIRLLKKTEIVETDYWFEGYVDSNHISIFIQNDSICAIGHITISENKLKKDGGFMSHLMQVKGVSYNGPLTGVEFELSNDKDNPDIFLKAVEDIID